MSQCNWTSRIQYKHCQDSDSLSVNEAIIDIMDIVDIATIDRFSLINAK